MIKLGFFERLRIRFMRRHVRGVSNFLGFPVAFTDKSSFLFMHDEIFGREIYRFNGTAGNPKILDCGANIGLATLYWKRVYPKASITAFEPDPAVFKTLAENVASARLSDVTLIQKGLASTEGTRTFLSEGADAGRIASEPEGRTRIETARLSSFLDAPVDFLKIDIEGSELEVLEEAKGKLGSVKNLFVEYHSRTDKPQGLDKILAIISSAGFRYFVESIGIKSEHPFERIEEYLGYDLQLNIFCTRRK